MENYQELLHRLRLGQSIRQISKDMGSHRTVIRKIRRLASDRNWLDSATSIPSLRDIQDGLSEAQAKSAFFDQLEMAASEIKVWLEKGYSKTVIHHLLKDRIHCSKSVVERFIRKKFPRPVDPVMLRSTQPGEVADVDFGYLGIVYDETLKQNRKAWFFSCRLRHSRKAYREIVLNQNEKTFFAAHIHAFEFFQGVPVKIVIDNLKAGVIEASLTDPVLNSSYKELAHHYGFIISPCAPYTPQHKGGVENDVKYVKHNFWPLFVESQKQKGRQIPYLNDLREHLMKWNEEVAERRKIAGIGKTVVEIFEEEEKQTLRCLPLERWDPIEWKKAKVGLDWRISYDSSYYSVPYQLIGQQVMICASDSTIRVFCDRIEVTCHLRATKKGEYVRKTEHAPPQLDEVLNATRESLVIRAEKLGGYILIAMMHLLTDNIQDQLNATRRLLDLEKRYGQLRLEAACHRAVAYSTISYTSIRKILEQELDRQPTEKDTTSTKAETYRFARSGEHYNF